LAAVAKPVVNPPPQPTAQVAGQTIAAASSVAGQTDGADPHASTGEGHLTSEKAKNRYPREDFAYIRELIMKQLVYPGVARRMNWSGKVTLSFVIGEDGSVSGIRVVESSGYPLLDRSAMDAVKNVASFPKPLASAEIVMPIQFKLM
jgi:protein TonB